jgi:PAS domain S-box-containing protein
VNDKDIGYVWFLESLDAVHRAIQGSSDLGEALNAALAVLVEVFACDRAWLLEAQGESWTPVMERTRPEYPGGLELGVKLPLTDGTARRHRRVLESDSAVQLNAEEVASVVVPDGVAPPRAILAMAINPKVGRPWILGLHQCSHVRGWNAAEERLFVEIGHRLADALSVLLAYREARESEQKLAQAQRVARLGYWERDVETFAVNYSEETYRIFGLSPELHTLEPARLAERLHPDDRHIMLEAYEQAIAGGPRYDVDYRVRLPDGVVRYVHSEADVIRDADGRPLRMFGTMQDVTERKELTREQEVLRRVATLVARATSPEEILARVTEEAGRLLGVDLTALVRSHRDADTETVIAGWSASGAFDGLGRTTPVGQLAQSFGLRAAVGVPIAVEAEIRGVMYAASTTGRPLRPDTEERLGRFTDLLATAYANAGAREELRRVADEQAALRRVATLVARGVAPERLLAAVAEEAGKALTSAEMSIIGRYTADHAIEFVGGWGRTGEPAWVGQRASLGGHNVSTLVYETAQPARVDRLEDEAAPVTAIARGSRARSSAGAPIEVEGRLWGLIIVASSRDEGLPDRIEHELAAFTELVATAVANTQAREELAASRARLVAAADETRRRIVRDLHDGAQNRLVQTIMTLTLARNAQERHDGDTARTLFDEALGHAEQANVELRELAQGILPSVLARGGLAASVEELVERLRLPVRIEVTPDRFRPEVEANAYFVVAEALTNLAKHSRARSATVAGWVEGSQLHVDVSDDGVGGARPEGSGLRGLSDRVAALGGDVRIDSPSGGGTRILASLPLEQ